MRIRRSSGGVGPTFAGEASPLKASPLIRADGKVPCPPRGLLACGSQRSSRLPKASPQWPPARCSPLTVARQRRILTGFPASSELFGCVDHYGALGNAGLAEGRHLVEQPDRGADQRQRERGAGAFAEAQVEVEERVEPEALQYGAVAQLLGTVRGDQVAGDCGFERGRGQGGRA